MASLADRITRYLLAQLRRREIHRVYEAASEVGLLESAFIDRSRELGGVWHLPKILPLILSGDQLVDRQQIAQLLLRTKPLPIASHDSMVPDDGQPRSMPKHRREQEEKLRASRPKDESAKDTSLTSQTTAEKGALSSRAGDTASSSQRTYVLRLLRDLAQPAKVADAAVALLIARAVGESVAGMSQLLDVLRMRDAMIVLKIQVEGFEDRFGEMLEAGLIVRQPAAQVDGFGQRSLSGSYREPPSRARRMITFGGVDIIHKSDVGIRTALAKARSFVDTPIVVADENDGELPARFLAGADLVVTQKGLDREFIVELLQICAGVAPKAAFFALNRSRLDPFGLGIDDLVLAVRPGRSVDHIVETLKLFANEKRDEDEKGEDHETKKTKAAKGKLTNTATARAAVQFEVTQPELPTSENREHAGRPAPMVEASNGYGDAKSWALDLKSDLTLWRQGELDWAEMSTRLLLSGPPGTGKTTFARAVRNTLQTPMIATSVSHWLEPGYLGDVLKAMTSAFEAAKAHAPCLLFIDELDNIGTRGRAGSNSDYWDSVINRMLELLDGARQRDGIIVVGATNHPDRIDPALLRSGRLEKHVVIPRPDTDTLSDILAYHLGDDMSKVLASRPLFRRLPTVSAQSEPGRKALPLRQRGTAEPMPNGDQP
jgi:cell division protease FtsH